MKKILWLVVIVSFLRADNYSDCCADHCNNHCASQYTIAFAHNGTQPYGECEQHEKLIKTEKNARYWLYQNDLYNPYYFKLETLPFDYFIAVLTDHIKKLEEKIAQGHTWQNSSSQYSTYLTSGLCGLMMLGVYKSYTLSFNKEYEGYIALAMQLGFMGTFCAVISAQKIYKLYRYKERLVERLNRDQRILSVLQNEKGEREAKANNAAAATAVNVATNIVTAIGQAIGTAVKPMN